MQGQIGSSYVTVVPEGHVYVVKQLTAFAAPEFGDTGVHFKEQLSQATLWSAFFDIEHGGWQGFYGALAFGAGAAFYFDVSSPLDAGADVYVGGYDLLASE